MCVCVCVGVKLVQDIRTQVGYECKSYSMLFCVCVHVSTCVMVSYQRVK